MIYYIYSIIIIILLLFIIILESKKKVEKKVGRLWEAREAPPQSIPMKYEKFGGKPPGPPIASLIYTSDSRYSLTSTYSTYNKHPHIHTHKHTHTHTQTDTHTHIHMHICIYIYTHTQTHTHTNTHTHYMLACICMPRRNTILRYKFKMKRYDLSQFFTCLHVETL